MPPPTRKLPQAALHPGAWTLDDEAAEVRKQELPWFLPQVKVEERGLATRRGPHATTSKAGGTQRAPPKRALWHGPVLGVALNTLDAKVDSPTDASATTAREHLRVSLDSITELPSEMCITVKRGDAHMSVSDAAAQSVEHTFSIWNLLQPLQGAASEFANAPTPRVQVAYGNVL